MVSASVGLLRARWAEDRTLKAAETAEVRERILALATDRFGAELRA